MINFSETSVEDIISVLRELREKYQVNDDVKINDAALVAAAILADRYITDRLLPDKAFDLIERAVAKLKREISVKLLELKSEDHKNVEREMERLQEQINTIDIEIKQAERNYNLSLVAELRYSKLPEIERKVETERVNLDRFEIADLSCCDEEVSARDIAEIVAQLTGLAIDIIVDSGITEQSLENRQRALEIHTRLLRDRIVFLDSEIDYDISNLIVAQLLFLEAEDAEKDIYLYINSPGGSVSAGMAILDTIEQIRPDVCTVCVGMAASMSGLLLSAGAKGKRMSLATGRMMLNKPSAGAQGQAVDLEIQRKEILYMTNLLNNLWAQHTGQSPEKIDRDTDRDFYLNAAQAKEYGLIDTIIDRRPK